jgi:hypothetical protein
MGETSWVTGVARVAICRECLELRGPCFDTFSRVERTQRCACEPEEPRWKAYDYNRAIELCRCCAAATVKSGSRWSPFFCQACDAHVRSYDRIAGHAAIPVGRHTAMNGILLDGGQATNPRAMAAFQTAMADLFGRVTRLVRWHRDRVRAGVRAMPGDDPVVPLDAYLARARARPEERRELVAEIARVVATREAR